MTTFDLDLSKYNLGWSDSDVEYAFKPAQGPRRGRRRPDQLVEGRAERG